MSSNDIMIGTSGWMQSASNTQVSFVHPDPMAFDINDIALALSRQPRYGGHGKFFYSVAQHSIYAALQASPETKMYALLHDAHEAYTGDIPGPLKELLGRRILKIEDKLQGAIHAGLGLPTYPTADQEREVDVIDKSLLQPEYHVLFDEHIWQINGVEPAPVNVVYWPMEVAQSFFLAYYFCLGSVNDGSVERVEAAIEELNDAYANEEVQE